MVICFYFNTILVVASPIMSVAKPIMLVAQPIVPVAQPVMCTLKVKLNSAQQSFGFG